MAKLSVDEESRAIKASDLQEFLIKPCYFYSYDACLRVKILRSAFLEGFSFKDRDTYASQV